MAESDRAGLRFIRAETLDVPTFFGIENLHFVDSEDSPVVRSVVRHPGAVVVVPIVSDCVVMIRQYRAAVDDDVLELPAGKLDVEGESLESAAIRECEEEIGYRPERMRQLVSFWNSPGFTDERMTVFVTEQLTRVGRNPIGPEEVASEIVEIPIGQLEAMLASGEIEDAKSMIGLMAYLQTQQHDTDSTGSPPRR